MHYILEEKKMKKRKGDVRKRVGGGKWRRILKTKEYVQCFFYS
jgi:hypothetical protein